MALTAIGSGKMFDLKSTIYDKSFLFSLKIIELYKKLRYQSEYVISKQLLRSATGIGAHVVEASAAESRKEVAHKMTLASKEARETLYWLLLIDRSTLVNLCVDQEIKACNELVNMLASIVKTTNNA